MIDLLVRGGVLFDGTGAPRRSGDLAIDAGRVVEIGRGLSRPAHRVIEVKGLAVSPGFFDLHTHYDAQWFWDPTASPSCWHGITSVLMGNCGFSLAPAGPEDREYLSLLFSQVEGISQELLTGTVDFAWESFGEYLDRIRPHLGVNVAAQVGHSALRHRVMGAASYERAATKAEIAQMQKELARAMSEGAIGFSTLQASFEIGPYEKPVPSQLAHPDELRALAQAIGDAGGGLVSVSPFPGGAEIAPEYRKLLVEMSRAARGAVLWNAFQHRWDQPEGWRDLLEWMEACAHEGAEIYGVAKAQRLDLEFTLMGTRLFVWFPTWHEILSLPHAEKVSRLRDPALRETLRREYSEGAEAPPTMSAREQVLHVLESPGALGLRGRALREIAQERGAPFVDTLLEIALADDLQTRFVYRGLMNGDEDAVRQIMNGPHCVPGVSDAGAHLDMDCGVDFSGELLGTFVRDEQRMSLEEGVRRLTSHSARVLGVTDRGTLAVGQAADLVIFDPDRIGSGAREWLDDVPGGGRRLVQRALGVERVIVNGETLIEDGAHSGALPGEVLARG